MKNRKNIGFLSNIGPDPLKNREATKPAFKVGPYHQHASERPFKWHFAGGYFDPPIPHQLKKKKTSKLDSL